MPTTNKRFVKFRDRKVAFYIRDDGTKFSWGPNDVLAIAVVTKDSEQYKSYNSLAQAVCDLLSKNT